MRGAGGFATFQKLIISFMYSIEHKLPAYHQQACSFIIDNCMSYFLIASQAYSIFNPPNSQGKVYTKKKDKDRRGSKGCSCCLGGRIDSLPHYTVAILLIW